MECLPGGWRGGMLESERCLSTFVISVRMLQVDSRNASTKSDWVRAGMGEVPGNAAGEQQSWNWLQAHSQLSLLSEDSVGVLRPTQREPDKATLQPSLPFNQSRACFVYFTFGAYA